MVIKKLIVSFCFREKKKPIMCIIRLVGGKADALESHAIFKKQLNRFNQLHNAALSIKIVKEFQVF